MVPEELVGVLEGELIEELCSDEEGGVELSPEEGEDEAWSEEVGVAAVGAEEPLPSDGLQATKQIVSNSAKSRQTVFFISSVPIRKRNSQSIPLYRISSRSRQDKLNYFLFLQL